MFKISFQLHQIVVVHHPNRGKYKTSTEVLEQRRLPPRETLISDTFKNVSSYSVTIEGYRGSFILFICPEIIQVGAMVIEYCGKGQL